MAQEINFGTKFIRICPTDNNKIEHSSNGKSWSTSYKGSSYGCFYDLAVFGGKIFAITSKGVYASKNGGSSWSTRYTGSSYGEFESIQVIGTELIAHTSKGTYVSKNEGRSWSKRN